MVYLGKLWPNKRLMASSLVLLLRETNYIGIGWSFVEYWVYAPSLTSALATLWVSALSGVHLGVRRIEETHRHCRPLQNLTTVGCAYV